MPKCTFCGKVYPVMKGLSLARNSGEVDYYCSSKCRKNAQLGRKPEKLAWVRKGKESKEIIRLEKEEQE